MANTKSRSIKYRGISIQPHKFLGGKMKKGSASATALLIAKAQVLLSRDKRIGHVVPERAV